MTRTIPLTRGYFTFVDEEDYKSLAQYKWSAQIAPNTVYARRTAAKAERELGYPRHIRMHRQLLECILDSDIQVDHLSHNGLDNRRLNLRACSKWQNTGNTMPHQRNTTGFKGVAWIAERNKYRAQIAIDCKVRHLGYFTDPVEGAMAYDRAALEQWGEFAYLNLPTVLRPNPTDK